MTNFGFTSISYDDPLARQTYVEELPMLAECLAFGHFKQELQTILRSISQISSMVQKLIEVLPKTLEYLTKENSYKVIYLIGEKLCVSSEESDKQKFLDLAEKTLQNMNDIQYEFKELIQPQLLSSNNEFGNKFALWRLARLTQICDDYSQFEELICKAFSQPDVTNTAEILNILHPDLAKKYIITAFMCPSDSAHISAINAIETHKIDAKEESIAIHLINEQSPTVLSRICKMPPEMINKELLEKLLETDSISTMAASLALASPHFEEVLSKLEKTGAVGCEINYVNFDNLKKCKSIPYDFLSLMLKESKELIKEKTINEIVSLDTNMVLTKLIIPRIGEKGNWRSRYNTIQIMKKMLELPEISNNEQILSDFAKYALTFIFDHTYGVRIAIFDLVKCFPTVSKEVTFILNSLFANIKQETLDADKKEILSESLTNLKPLIICNYNREKIESICHILQIDVNQYFGN